MMTHIATCGIPRSLWVNPCDAKAWTLRTNYAITTVADVLTVACPGDQRPYSVAECDIYAFDKGTWSVYVARGENLHNSLALELH